jgi:hypothetical protein
MANVGDEFSPGDKIPVAGVYRHVPCGNEATFSDVGDKIPPCGKSSCPNRGGKWKLVRKTGTT